MAARRKGASVALVAAGVLSLACFETGPRPPKPQEVFHEILYAGLGWSPDFAAWYFLKKILEQRDYRWGSFDSGGPGWLPALTHSRYTVCAVDPDGSNPRELYEVDPAPFQGRFSYSAVARDGRLIVATGRDIHLLGPGESRRLTRLAKPIGGLDYSAAASRLCVVTGHGLHVVDLATGDRRRITRGNDSRPRFSPDGERILFTRSQEAPRQTSFIVYDIQARKERALFQDPLNMGLFHTGLEWRHDAVAWLRSVYIGGQAASGEPGFEPLPLPDDCSGAARAVVSSQGCDGEPGHYAYFGRVGPPWTFGMANIAGTVKLVDLQLADGPPPDNCHLRALFCREPRYTTVASNADWDEAVAGLRDENGEIW